MRRLSLASALALAVGIFAVLLFAGILPFDAHSVGALVTALAVAVVLAPFYVPTP